MSAPQVNNNNRTRARIDAERGDEKLHKATNTIFNPTNLKMYHVVLIVLLVLMVYVFMANDVAYIFKALVITALVCVTIIESVIIFTYVNIPKSQAK